MSTVIKIDTLDLLNQRSKELLSILENNQFLDVTLLTETEEISAHKLILSAASPVLRRIFERSSERHPIVFMKGSKPQHIRALLDYIYKGEVLVESRDLNDFINLVDDLKIKGLGESIETHFENELKVSTHYFNEPVKEVVKDQEAPQEILDSSEGSDISFIQEQEGELNFELQQCSKQIEEQENETKQLSTKRKYKKRRKLENNGENDALEELTQKKNTVNKRGRPKKTIDKASNETPNIRFEYEDDSHSLEASSSEIMSEFGLSDYGDDEMNMEEKKSWEAQARAYLRTTNKYRQLRESLLTMVIKHTSHNYGCTECEARMPSRSKALEHVGQHEDKLDTKHKFVCDCGNSYSKMTSIRFHYPCPEALKKFIQSVQSVATKYSASTSEIAEALSFTTNVDEDL